VDAAKDADILIFVVPHQFIKGLGAALLGKIKPTAVGLSLIKGFDVAEGGGIELISHIITRHLKVSLKSNLQAVRFVLTVLFPLRFHAQY
jgi:glycerol-3-phosphate dehydrogenase (NAD+)